MKLFSKYIKEFKLFYTASVAREDHFADEMGKAFVTHPARGKKSRIRASRTSI